MIADIPYVSPETCIMVDGGHFEIFLYFNPVGTNMAVSYLRQLDATFSPWRPMFSSW
jgi:hypothetical protein